MGSEMCIRDRFWGVGDAAGGGALWHSGDGRRWRRVQDLAGGRPVDVAVYLGRVYVSGTGSDGRGILWGPPPSSSLNLAPGPPPTWPSHPTPGAVDWTAAGMNLKNAVSNPDAYRTRLRHLAYGWAPAVPPLGFFAAARDCLSPDQTGRAR